MLAMSSMMAVPPTESSVHTLSLFVSVGIGAGGIFVTGLLVYLQGYLSIIKARERNQLRLQSLLVMASIPLVFAFAGIVVFESLSVLDLL